MTDIPYLGGGSPVPEPDEYESFDEEEPLYPEDDPDEGRDENGEPVPVDEFIAKRTQPWHPGIVQGPDNGD